MKVYETPSNSKDQVVCCLACRTLTSDRSAQTLADNTEYNVLTGKYDMIIQKALIDVVLKSFLVVFSSWATHIP